MAAGRAGEQPVDGDIGTVLDLTLMEEDTDWYAFDVPLQSGNVTATAELSDHCRGDAGARVCVDVSVYSQMDELMDGPPRHLGGPFCGGLAEGVASDRLAAMALFGEEWMTVVVQVDVLGVPAGPVAYRLAFTH